MTKADKKKMLKANTIYWITAMVLPGVVHLAFKAFASESARFPWPVIMPLLFIGLALASNNMLSEAIGKPTDE